MAKTIKSIPFDSCVRPTAPWTRARSAPLPPLFPSQHRSCTTSSLFRSKTRKRGPASYFQESKREWIHSSFFDSGCYSSIRRNGATGPSPAILKVFQKLNVFNSPRHGTTWRRGSDLGVFTGSGLAVPPASGIARRKHKRRGRQEALTTSKRSSPARNQSPRRTRCLQHFFTRIESEHSIREWRHVKGLTACAPSLRRETPNLGAPLKRQWPNISATAPFKASKVTARPLPSWPHTRTSVSFLV